MNRMPSFLIATLICAAPIPGTAAEQAEPLQATEQVRLHAQAFTQAGLGSEESLQFAASLEKARVPQSVTLRLAETLRACLEEKLPGTPLMDKLREGLAKGVPAEELLRAVERVRSRYAFGYRHAFQLPGTSPEAQRTGGVIAEALAAGLAERDAERILEHVRLRERDQQQSMARACFSTARTMAQFQVGSDAIADTLEAALQHAFQLRDMEQLRLRFMEQARIMDPAKVVTQFMLRLRAGQSLEGPSSMGHQAPGSGSPQNDSNGKGSGGKEGPGGRGKGPS